MASRDLRISPHAGLLCACYRAAGLLLLKVGLRWCNSALWETQGTGAQKRLGVRDCGLRWSRGEPAGPLETQAAFARAPGASPGDAAFPGVTVMEDSFGLVLPAEGRSPSGRDGARAWERAVPRGLPTALRPIAAGSRGLLGRNCRRVRIAPARRLRGHGGLNRCPARRVLRACCVPMPAQPRPQVLLEAEVDGACVRVQLQQSEQRGPLGAALASLAHARPLPERADCPCRRRRGGCLPSGSRAASQTYATTPSTAMWRGARATEVRQWWGCSWRGGGVARSDVRNAGFVSPVSSPAVAIYWEGNDPSDPPRTLTYRELLDLVCQIANQLKAMGVQQGDCGA